MTKLRGQFELVLADGTKVNLLVNMYALGEYVEEAGIELYDLEKHLEQNALSYVPKLLWHAARAFCMLNDTEIEISRGKFLVLLGSTPLDELLEIITQAMNLDDGKKKLPTKTKRKAK